MGRGPWVGRQQHSDRLWAVIHRLPALLLLGHTVGTHHSAERNCLCCACRYGLTYPGCGFVVWKSKELVPQDMVHRWGR